MSYHVNREKNLATVLKTILPSLPRMLQTVILLLLLLISLKQHTQSYKGVVCLCGVLQHYLSAFVIIIFFAVLQVFGNAFAFWNLQ